MLLKTERLELRLDSDLTERIDVWRGEQDDLPSRSEAVRRLVEGGLIARKRAGLPVLADRRRPLELQRQIQIAAGSMVLAGTLLGVFASPWFHLVPGFVGAGLVFAGLTGFCGLARVLVRAPWNRESASN